MKKKPSEKPKEKKKSAQAHIDIGGNVDRGNIIVGDNNVINQTPEQIKLRSIYQLPPAPADFTGRETLITELLKDFDSHKGAAISGLTGMGGIGKTALGLVIANQLKEKYPDGQILLDLKGTTTPLSALDIAKHVILSFEPTADLRELDESNLSGAFQSILHYKKVLLYFDNARSGEQIAPLIPPDSCALLVTSRWTFPITGLKNHKLGVLNETEAVNFLLEVCPHIGESAKELAKACAYLPLALRIASSFLQVNHHWMVEKYIEELSTAKNRLGTLTKSREQAELTSEPDLFATFELSYNQLIESQQRKWRVLGVFPAPFDNSAIASMWNLRNNENVEDLIGLLIRYSLVDFTETTSSYEMHDLLAEYALSKMESGEEQESWIKHASHYMNVMVKAEELYLKDAESVLAGLRLFDSVWTHFRAAQAWVVGNMEISDTVAKLVMLYPSAATYCLDLRLRPREKINWLESAKTAAELLERKDIVGIHIGNLGVAYKNLGEVRKAIELYEQALVIDREIGDRRGEGTDLGNLGNAYAELGEEHKAIEFYEQHLLITRETGDRSGEGGALGNLGVAYAELGEARKAIGFYEQALIIDREIGNRRGEGGTLGNLGVAYKYLNEVRKAIEFYEQHLVIAREIGDRRGEGSALGNLGNAYAELGEARKAIGFYEQALIIDQEIGDRSGEGNDLGNWGVALYDLGEKERGIDLVQQALIIYETIESPYAEWARNKLKAWDVLK